MVVAIRQVSAGVVGDPNVNPRLIIGSIGKTDRLRRSRAARSSPVLPSKQSIKNIGLKTASRDIG